MATVKPLVQYPEGVEEIRSTDTLDGAPSGSGLPTGGVAGQLLRKKTAAAGDAEWGPKLTVANALPTSPAEGDMAFLYDQPIGPGGGQVDEVIAGAGISVNATDPIKPIVTASVVSVAGKTGVVLIAAGDVASGVFAPARLGTGVADATTVLYGDGTWKTAPAGGGLTGLASSLHTSSPNATVHVSRLLSNATSTNADLVIQPKGTGGLLAQLPDNTITGGNKRGIRAVDLQMSRSLASQVASGANSLAVGTHNTASNSYAVAIGYLNVASNQASVAIGSNNNVDGISALGVGSNNNVYGPYAACFGYNNSVSGQGSIAVGEQVTVAGSYASGFGRFTQVNLYGMHAHGGPDLTGAGGGGCQRQNFILGRKTSDNVATRLCLDGTTEDPYSTLLAIEGANSFRGLVVAQQVSAGTAAGWEIKGVIINNGSTVGFIGTPTVTLLANSTGYGLTVTLTANATDGTLDIVVTGAASTDITWACSLETVRVTT